TLCWPTGSLRSVPATGERIALRRTVRFCSAAICLCLTQAGRTHLTPEDQPPRDLSKIAPRRLAQPWTGRPNRFAGRVINVPVPYHCCPRVESPRAAAPHPPVPAGHDG